MSEPFQFDRPMDHFFELSYAQYLTIPRIALNSMPVEWQRRMVACLEELDESIDWRPKDGRYWVELRDSDGRIAKDPLREYRRAPCLPMKERPQEQSSGPTKP